jgi:Arc/MetJ-type ribon-helix-helix transcriptional regulator
MGKSTNRVTIRVSAQEREQIEVGAKRRGCSSASSLIRTAIRNELDDRTTAAQDAENRLVASLEGLSRDIGRVARGQQALFAVVDTLVKTFLTCVPEPPRDGMTGSLARAHDRYTRFLKSAGQSMAGDSLAALHDLVDHADR